MTENNDDERPIWAKGLDEHLRLRGGAFPPSQQNQQHRPLTRGEKMRKLKGLFIIFLLGMGTIICTYVFVGNSFDLKTYAESIAHFVSVTDEYFWKMFLQRAYNQTITTFENFTYLIKKFYSFTNPLGCNDTLTLGASTIGQYIHYLTGLNITVIHP